MKNQRKSKRYKTDIKAEILPSESSYISLPVTVVNMSMNGIRVLISNRLLIYSTVAIRIKLPPNDYELSLMGMVVWLNPSFRFSGSFDTGIKFNFVSDFNKKLIRNYVLKRPKKEVVRKFENKYLEAFKTIDAKDLNAEYNKKYSAKSRYYMFLAIVIMFGIAILIFLYFLLNYLDLIGIPGLHF